MKKLILVLLITIILVLPAKQSFGIPPAHPYLFLELWNNLAYYDTNLEKPRFASVLGRFEGKVGLNFFHYPIQFYGVYYGVSSQDPNYWNNSLFSGGGVRVMPFGGFNGGGIVGDLIRGVKIYYEDLSASYMKDAVSAEAAGLADTDKRYGIEIYREWNLDDPDLGAPWGELWFKYDYRETNFVWGGEEFKTDVFYFQPKLGRHLGDGIEIYLRADITASGKEGPAYSFLNIADYGVGLRFEPWRQTGQTDDLLRKFKMFTEILGVSYLKDKPANAANVVDSDVRFGVEFSYGR